MTQIVILAAGSSSRFFPFSEKTSKTMFSLCGKPILGWTLDGLKKTGFNDVIIVVAKKDKYIQDYLTNYKDLSVKVVYQEEALGMGDALLSAKKYLKKEFIVGFGHFINPKAFELIQSERASGGASIGIDETDEPWKYGILTLRGDRAVGIIEKPKKGEESGNIRAAGLYLLNRKYLEILEKIPVAQYNFETALDKFMKEETVGTVKLEQSIFPFKYVWDLVKIKNYLLETINETKAKDVFISDSAILKGKVIIEEGAKIFDHALVEGPVYIGKNAVVGAYSTLRDHSILEEGAEIQRYADVTRSIFGAGSHMHSGFVGDSVLGNNVRLGAGFVTANRRVDRGDVEVEVKGEKTTSGSSYLGVMIGDSVKIGINVSTMPGIVIGPEALIGPGTSVMNNIAPKTLVYSDHRKDNITEKIK